ncbi:MAG: cache domain-containing protein, partial [Chloroflexota bacterium]
MKDSLKIGFFQSMRGKIFLLFMALSLIPMAITGIIIVIQSQQSIKADIEAQYNTITDLQVKEITNWIIERKSDVVTLAGIARIQSLDPEKACPAVKQYFDQWGIYQDIFVALPDGSRLCDAIGGKTSVSDRDYFQEAIQGKTVISDPLISKTTGTPVIIFATPLIVEGKIIGVVATSMSTTYFTDLLSVIQSGKSREGYLVSRDGIFITASRFTDDLKKMGLIKENVELELKIDTPGLRKALGGESGIAEYPSYHNTMVLGAYRPIPELGTGAVLLVEQEIGEVMSVSNRLRDIILIIGVICAVIVTILAQVFGRSLTQPLEIISNALNNLAQGNLNQELLS